MLNPYARPTVHTTLIAIRLALKLVATTPSEREDWEKREIAVGWVGQVRTIDKNSQPAHRTLEPKSDTPYLMNEIEVRVASERFKDLAQSSKLKRCQRFAQSLQSINPNNEVRQML